MQSLYCTTCHWHVNCAQEKFDRPEVLILAMNDRPANLYCLHPIRGVNQMYIPSLSNLGSLQHMCVICKGGRYSNRIYAINK